MNIFNILQSEGPSMQTGPAMNAARAGQAKDYRTPRLVAVGKAGKLVRNQMRGEVRDYSYGWWMC